MTSGTWAPYCPRPPDWRVDWDDICATYPWVADLADCPQDPVHHAEGDVAIHTRLACEALALLPAFRERPVDERAVLFMATLLHDVAKPLCTREDIDGRITARGHSRRGAVRARVELWRTAAPFGAREQVCGIIGSHQVPFFLAERADWQRRAIEASQSARCDLLAIVAEADARGRVCADAGRLLENIALFVEASRELDCLDRPYAFPSDHARFQYFRTPGRDPCYPAFDDTRVDVTLMAGLPGAGKDHWVREHAAGMPVVSLDALREEMGVEPTEPQGAVARRAREQARVYLRAGTPFVWNATNLSRDMRARPVNLFADYNARVRIVYVEAGPADLHRRNAARSNPVPAAVLERLLDRWEVPTPVEAHRVDVVLDPPRG